MPYVTLCSTWTQLPPEKRAHPLPPNFWPMSIVAEWLDGWMKAPLGAEVDLDSGHIVLGRVPAPAKGAQHPPLFGSCLLWLRSPISTAAELLYKTVIVIWGI